MNAALLAAAHDGKEDCAFNFGRECDCSAAAETVARILVVVHDAIDAGVNDIVNVRTELGYDSPTAFSAIAQVRTRIRKALS